MAHEHTYGSWRRPIGQLKVRQCSGCGCIQNWDAYLQAAKTA